MQIETLSHSTPSGWSAKAFPALDSARTLVIAFGASRYFDNHAALGELARAYPSSRVVGCSTSGEIFGTQIEDDSLAVAVMRFERADVRATTTAVANAESSFEAGARIARDLADARLKAIFVLSDGLKVNGSELVRGINSVVPRGVAVTGGLAGDGARFQRTWVLCNGRPASGVVSAVGFYGDSIHVGHGSKGGWDLFGPERRVTRSKHNVLYEIDGKPALELYKEYLGERAAGLPATGLLFPLALRAKSGEEKQLVRTILAVSEAEQSMTFAGDVPEGHLVQLMRANFDRLVDGAIAAASMASSAASASGDTLSIAISCVGRRLVLGERSEEECEATLDVLPRGTRQIGFYSYGEISPYASGSCDLHNQTMTLTTISER